MILTLIISINHPSSATHIRAADIYGERISRYTYEFTLTVFTSTSVSNPNANEALLFQGSTIIEFSDGTDLELDGSVGGDVISITEDEIVDDEIYRYTIVFRHTFPQAGREYQVRYYDENRISDIENIKGSSLVPFQVEHEFFLIASDFENTSPILTYSPIDNAAVGETFFHNPGAYDPDGDSIAFKLSTPRGPNGELLQKVNNFNNVPGGETAYMDPNMVGDGPNQGTTFSLDPIRGDLIWDYPVKEGIYNVAFLVEEWRNGVPLSVSRRDMQIIVDQSDNVRPELYIPEDTCFAATTTLEEIIAALDPDGETVDLSSFGQVFDINNPASFTLVNGLPSDTAAGIFNWTPNCDQIQNQPYQAQFRATDTYQFDISLTTIETWLINVVGPAPENLVATQAGDDFALNWDTYSCTNASTISIYRAECDTSQVTRSGCITGVPEEWGFVKIGEVPADQTFFLDNNGGIPFKNGIEYQYIIAAEFPSPKGGESYASNIATIGLALGLPIITQASVTITDQAAGEIELEIASPKELDAGANPGPYTFEIFRQEGSGNISFTNTPVFTFTQNTLNDTIYVDENLNTLDMSYAYGIRFYSNGNLLGEYETSSSTFLEAIPGNNQITLEWSKNSPWIYVDSLYHVIWSDSSGAFEILDSVPGTQTSLTIDNLTPYDTICFWVETKGVFCNELLSGVSINNTQEICTAALDTIPPCPPLAALDVKDCSVFDENTSLENFLSWELANCDYSDLAGYRIYARRIQENNYSLIATISDTATKTFLHQNLNTLTYCYEVRAVDLSGNESENNIAVCGDNCEYFELPNTFTPNADNINDFFIPYPVPRAVENLTFKVYNRWGKLVFSAENLEELKWNGVATDGSILSPGTYYYMAEVTFDKRNPADRNKKYKGWIELIRK